MAELAACFRLSSIDPLEPGVVKLGQMVTVNKTGESGEIPVRWSVVSLLKFNVYFLGCALFYIFFGREENLKMISVVWLVVINFPFMVNWIPARIRKDGFVIWDRIGTRFYRWSDVEEFKIRGKALAFEPTVQCRESIANERSFLAGLRRFLIADRIKQYRFPASIQYSPEELLKIIQHARGQGHSGPGESEQSAHLQPPAPVMPD